MLYTYYVPEHTIVDSSFYGKVLSYLDSIVSSGREGFGMFGSRAETEEQAELAAEGVGFFLRAMGAEGFQELWGCFHGF